MVSLVGGAETEKGPDGAPRDPASIVPKDELVEVDLQVVVREVAVAAVQPSPDLEGQGWAPERSHSSRVTLRHDQTLGNTYHAIFLHHGFLGHQAAE
ncbi:MAG TPA: hypothetical protein VIJ21_09900 [Solirubrobacterales bacterium]